MGGTTHTQTHTVQGESWYINKQPSTWKVKSFCSDLWEENKERMGGEGTNFCLFLSPDVPLFSSPWCSKKESIRLQLELSQELKKCQGPLCSRRLRQLLIWKQNKTKTNAIEKQNYVGKGAQVPKHWEKLRGAESQTEKRRSDSLPISASEQCSLSLNALLFIPDFTPSSTFCILLAKNLHPCSLLTVKCLWGLWNHPQCTTKQTRTQRHFITLSMDS